MSFVQCLISFLQLLYNLAYLRGKAYSIMKIEFSGVLVKSFLLLVFSGGFIVNAQRIKLDLGAGYGFGLTNTYFTTGTSETDQSTGVLTKDLQSNIFNYNQGVSSHLKLNYALNSQLFLVAGARYQNGKRSYDPLASGYVNSTPYYVEQSDFKYQQLDVQIGLGIEKKIADRWSVYFSHGFTFFVFGKAVENHVVEADEPGSPILVEQTIVEEPSFTFGAYGDIGLVYRLSDRFSLFFNTTVQSKNWSTKRSRITQFTQDGVDQIPENYTSQLEAEYAASVEYNSSTPPNTNQPSTLLKTWMPNSGLETVLGVRYGFGADPPEKESFASLSRLYLQSSIGYGMPMSERTLISSSKSTDVTSSSTITQSDSRLYSYGKGLSGQLLMGYSPGKGISAEIGAVFNTSRFSTLDKEQYQAFNYPISTWDLNTDYSAWMLRNTYGLKMESDFKKINAFIRTGLSLGFAGLTETITRASSTFPSTTQEVQTIFEYRGNLSVGAYIGLGASLRLNQRLDLVAEAVTYIQNWSPKKRELVSYSVDGVNYTEQLSTYEKEVEYLSELNGNYSTTDFSSPEQRLRIAEPFSSFMLTLGLRWHLVKGK